MLLIDLPPELLQLVLLYSSTPSFVQLIRACRTIFDLGAQSRQVVLHHLSNLPGGGQAVSYGVTSTQQLFRILRQRAAKSLQGVTITADRQDYYFAHAPIDVSASCVTSLNASNVALVRKGGHLVHIHEAFQGQLKRKGVLASQMEDCTAQRPLQTTFDRANNVYVLFSSEKDVIGSASRSDDCIEPVVEATLTRASLSALSRPHDSWDINTAKFRTFIKSSESVRAIAMTAHGGSVVSIAWDTGFCVDYAKYTSIALYTLLRDGSTHSKCVNDVPKDLLRPRPYYEDSPEHCKYATSKIAFSNGGRALKCYSAAMITPCSRINRFRRDSTENVAINKLGIDVGTDSTEWFFIEDPFFGHHETFNNGDDAGAFSCENIRLSFATTTITNQKLTIACILRSSKTMPEDDCTHAINLDEQHALASTPSIEVVARLWAFQPPTTTIAAGIAFAEQGTRIAIAYWDKIYVWPLQPQALAGTGHWTHRDSYKKTYDKNLQCRLVELKPIVLKAEAVVHQMAFTACENELVAITDKGLQLWDLGPSAIGRRTSIMLPDEEVVFPVG